MLAPGPDMEEVQDTIEKIVRTAARNEVGPVHISRLPACLSIRVTFRIIQYPSHSSSHLSPVSFQSSHLPSSLPACSQDPLLFSLPPFPLFAPADMPPNSH
jgi:hypothetical protein